MSRDDDSESKDHNELLREVPIARLYIEHRARLRSWLAKSYPHEDKLDDMVQEVFLRLARRMRARDQEAVRAPLQLLYFIAKRILIDQIRQRAGQAALEPLDTLDPLDPIHQVPDPAMPLDEQLSREQLLRQERLIVEALPEEQRRVLQLQLSGLKPAQIADRLQLRISTVRRLLQLAYRRCHRKLRALGFADDHADQDPS